MLADVGGALAVVVGAVSDNLRWRAGRFSWWVTENKSLFHIVLY